jgi:acyl-CoA reductase-like NAD-dependent aldehyde dehydrogenase
MSTVDFHAFSNVIAGALRSSAHLGHGINPSTREPLWNVPIATAQDLEDAVSAAQEASTKWSSTPWEKRQDCLGRAKVLLEQHRTSIAQLLSLEGGKPPQFGDLEVQHALDFFNFYCMNS